MLGGHGSDDGAYAASAEGLNPLGSLRSCKAAGKDAASQHTSVRTATPFEPCSTCCTALAAAASKAVMKRQASVGLSSGGGKSSGGLKSIRFCSMFRTLSICTISMLCCDDMHHITVNLQIGANGNASYTMVPAMMEDLHKQHMLLSLQLYTADCGDVSVRGQNRGFIQNRQASNV